MIVVSRLDDLQLDGPVLLTIGTFDGVHRGHRFLLEQAQRRAEEHGYRFLIVTFDPPPAVVLRPSLGRYQLTEAAEKVRLLAELGPAAIAMLPFTLELAKIPADKFMAAIEARVRLREIWLGEDFHFGRDREGGLAMLVERGQASGFALHVVARRQEHASSISSSRIRAALADGAVGDVIPLLGRPFSRAVNGGVPTFRAEGSPLWSGLEVAPPLALPADGTYACLLSSKGVDALAVAARVRQKEDRQIAILADDPIARELLARVRQNGEWQSTLEAAGPVSLPAYLEFIERLPASQDNPADELAHARDWLARWERPVYPAAGDY